MGVDWIDRVDFSGKVRLRARLMESVKGFILILVRVKTHEIGSLRN